MLGTLRSALAPGGALHALTAFKHFCVYEIIPSASRPGKTDKIPRMPVKWGSREELLDAETALTMAECWTLGPGATAVGVGYIVQADDPFFFLDMDGCVGPDGNWLPLVHEMFGRLPGAAFEISSSGKGCHFFGRTAAFDHAKKNVPLGLELYTGDRLAALTGVSACGDAGVDLTGPIQAVGAQFFPPHAASATTTVEWLDQAVPEWFGPTDDDALIARMLASVKPSAAAVFGGASSARATVADLWAADPDALGRTYPSSTGGQWDGSSVDMALACHLAFWTGKNPVRMERLMRMSALDREKWDMRPEYLANTIERAIAQCDQVLGAGRAVAKRPLVWTTESLERFPREAPVAEVIAGLCSNPESRFAQAWNACDLSGILPTLAWRMGSNCEAMLAAVLMRKSIPDTEDLRQQIMQVAAATDRWATSAQTEEALAPADTRRADAIELSRKGIQAYGVEDQAKLFAGCVYISNADKIMDRRGILLDKRRFDSMIGGGTFTLTSNSSTKSAYEAFLGSHYLRFPRVDLPEFRPDLPPGELIDREGLTSVNTWVPIDVPSRPGDVSLFLDHLRRMLPDERDRRILLAYMAAVVQFQGRKFTWAPVLQGDEGNGKGIVSTFLREAVGRRYFHAPQAADLANKFNSWLVGKILIAVQEINVGGEHKLDVLDALKEMVTEPVVGIQGKGSDQYTGTVCCNFFFTTNRKGAMGKGAMGRRYAVFFTAQQTEADIIRDGMDEAYFTRLRAWASSGGYAHVTHFLQNYPLADDEFNPAGRCHRAPRTSSFAEVKVVVRSRDEAEVHEAIDSGAVGFRSPWISSNYLTELLRGSRSMRAAREEMLLAMGYVRHPGLKDGRTNNPVMPDNRKAILYVKHDHPAAQLRNAADIARQYSEAQTAALTEQTAAIFQAK